MLAKSDCLIMLAAEAVGSLFEKNLDPVSEEMIDHVRSYLNDETNIAHDLWLTRNGHGTGFWDRQLGISGEVGDALTTIAESFKPMNVVVGEDGKLHLEAG